ncbi:AzlC family ABC transporter permease [Dickeya dadantii]|uniref:AzlC family ABC transporter permease n=1 Tax=Dickeya dadantii TaxID=204038 RepID=UPI001495C8EF|nr:AzlC family ABC transporter permease [Dickeya dadantii]NPE51998.1 branched-chain amino acid ABC transporter permease [Dickeya dadantii]NPE54844.1 AzlC family ABC transporter permease [Dickeya dadantii]NPE67354.1 AzlC family ABC transporter permease [Dickeya dadantii]
MSRLFAFFHTGTFANEFSRGLVAAIPVMIGFVPFGLLLGAQAAQKGFSASELVLMTGLNFGGGSEFAAMSLWTSPPHVLTIVLVSMLINSRHLLMGASFAPFLAHLPRRHALLALFFMCDESWAMSVADAAKRRQQGSSGFSMGFYAGVASALWLVWVISTGVGVIVGPVLGDVTEWGFDMAFPAVFLVLLKGMWRGLLPALPWLVSLVCAAATYHFWPGAAYVPVGAATGMLAILLLNGKTS